MKNLSKNFTLVVVPIILLSLSLMGCDDSNEARRGAATTISGTVEGPIAANRTIEKRSTFFTKIGKFLNIIKPAEAQGDEIEVLATQNGEVVDSTVTVNNTYMLEVPSGGTVTLDYITSDETFSLDINVTPSSKVTLDVDLELSPGGPLVDIQVFDITSPRIITRDDETFAFEEARARLTIEGGGEDCIRSTGISLDPNKVNVDIRVDELNLDRCNSCIFTDDNQRVDIKTAANEQTASGFPIDEGEIFCSSSGDGIKAEEASTVKIENENRDGEIIINSTTADGIKASGIETLVDINPGSRGCSIDAVDEAIVAEDGAIVNADCQTEPPPLMGGCNSVGAQVVTKNQFGFGKYVFDI
ncbi:MAG: hypothetical protein ACRENW_04345, partial [Thermodesulfobacteriota bacterium]